MKRSSNWIAVLPSLVIPICIGLTLYLGMCAMLERDIIENETVIRYVAGHPVSKLTMALFFIGLGSLGMIAANLIAQYRWTEKIQLTDDPTESSPVVENGDGASGDGANSNGDEDDDAETADPESANRFAKQLLKFPQSVREHYMWRRLHDALHYVHRTSSSAGIEDELKYLGDMDADRQQQRYSLIRILIWATPMLGFLGTVLGISQALGGINVGPENNFQQMLGSLRGSLYIAFDTTALALTLSMVLMFGQFFIDRFESQLLRLVDYRSRRELASQFVMSSTGDEAMDSIQRLGRTVLNSNNEMVKNQTVLWQKSIAAAEKAWVETLTGANERVGTNLAGALDSSVENLSHYLGQTIRKADDSMASRLEQWQVSLSENARNLREHQDELSLHTKQISAILERMGNVSEFQSALKANEHAVDATRELQETLNELVEVVKTSKVVPVNTFQDDATEQTELHRNSLMKKSSGVTEHSNGEHPNVVPFVGVPFVGEPASEDSEFEKPDFEEIVDEESADEEISDKAESDTETFDHAEAEETTDDIESEPAATIRIADSLVELRSSEVHAVEPFVETVSIESSADATEQEESISIKFRPNDERDPSVASSTDDDSRNVQASNIPLPRYLQAEIHSGHAPSVSFPVEIVESTPAAPSSSIEATKKAA